MEEYEIGIFFNLEEMSRRDYSTEAWEIFAGQCRPEMLKSSKLFQGEVSKYLPDVGQSFCIGVRTGDLLSIQYLKQVFGACDDIRLASPLNRVRESEIISKFRLKYKGRVDSKGRLKTKKWSRMDHDICKANGWPYVPRDYPDHLSAELVKELEKMERPEFGLSESPADKASSKRTPAPKNRGSWRFALRKIVSYGLVAAAVGLFALAFLAREQIFKYLREEKELLATRLILGDEGYQRYREGFAMANINRIPQDLELQALNKKLASKGYYVTRWAENSPVDTWIDCSVWFASNESRNPLPATTTQAFIRINMKSLDGNLIWVCQGKGVRSSPGREAENQHLPKVALLSAIENLDLSCLPDGKSVKNFQANNDFAALRRHVDYLLALNREDPEEKGPPGVEVDLAESPREKKQAVDSSPSGQTHPPLRQHDPGRKRQRDSLRTELYQYLTDQWIMTHRVYLKTGRQLDALILEEKKGVLRLRVPEGIVSFPRMKIAKIEPLDIKDISKNTAKILNKIRKGLNSAWQQKECDLLEKEFCEKYLLCGPPLPGVSLLSMNQTGKHGELEAVVKTGKGEIVVKKGDRVAGFEVTALDKEDNSVLVRMGEGGDTLRIYPRSAWNR